MTRNDVLAWCRAQALFPGGGPVTAALSGGADSVAMLHLLLSLQDALGITVSAAHFNHRLRGGASDGDEAFCRALCARLGVSLRVGGADVAALAARRGCGVETAARDARYEFLLAGGGTVATAHTADDNLETMLLHLTRGAALRGLGGIPPRRGRIVRPILCLTRDDVLDYLATCGLPHVEDETNAADGCPRNRLRHHAVPLLRDENHRAVRAALDAACSLRADEAFLQAPADALLAGARRDGGWDAAALAGASQPLRLRALRRLLEDGGVRSLTQRHLEAAERLLSAGPSASLALPGLTLRRQYGLLVCGPAPDGAFEPFGLAVPGRHALPGGRVLACDGPFPYGGEPGLCLALPGPYTVRPRAAGDTLRLRGGRKTLKKWMIDRKLPAALRGGLPVFVRGGRVAAAWGVGADPDFRPQPGALCCRITILERGRQDDDTPL